MLRILYRMVLVALVSGPSALALTSCDKAPEPAPPTDEAAKPETQAMHVVLNGEQIKHMGIQTVAIERATYMPLVQGFAVVIRFDDLAQSDAEVRTAEAAASQSDSALARAQKLSESKYLSGAALDAAKKQAATDDAQLALARRKQAVAFGRNAPWNAPDKRRAIFASLMSGEKRLVRATFPAGALRGQTLGDLWVRGLSDPTGRRVQAESVWDAPADATVPGRSFFALVAGVAGAEGERLVAFAGTGSALDGVRIPQAALILSDGTTWCYVAQQDGVFERRPVDMGRPLPDGYFASQGFRVGERVVIQGQGLLLAYETNPEGEEEE